jgi:hypothetical protein
MSRKVIILFFAGLFLSATVFADTMCNFHGDINFAQRIFQMQINFKEKEKVDTVLKLLGNDNYYFNANVQHIKVSNFDLSTNFESTGRLLKDNKGGFKTLKGLFWSNYSLVNYKPFREMSGTFELDKNLNRFTINSFTWGNIELNGSIGLIYPHDLSLVLAINDMDVSEFAIILGVPIEDLDLEGLINGKIKIEGFISSPQIKGQLRASNGNINELRYSDIFVNVEGSYPLINIVDSGIVEEGGTPYNLEGRLDLRQLNNFNSPSNSIKVNPSSGKGFSWQSWNISRKQNNFSDDRLKLEYKLKPNRPFGIRFEDNQEILGVEHKIKF